MKKLILILIALSGVVCVAHAKEAKKTYEEKEIGKNGVFLKARIDKKIKGNNAFLLMHLMNKGNTDITYGHIATVNDFYVQVFDENGKEVGFTGLGKIYLEGRDTGAFYKYVVTTLKPNTQYAVKLNLALYFDISTPGNYTVSIRQRVNPLAGDMFKLELSKIPFRVFEDKPTTKTGSIKSWFTLIPRH